MKPSPRAWLSLVAFALLAAGTRGAPKEIVLFPLDDFSLPFNRGLNLHFIAGSKHQGLRMPAEWRGKTELAGVTQPVRLRVNFSGRDANKTRLYAIYVE